MRISELILLDAEESGFRFLLFYVYTPITDEQSPITIQSSDSCQLTPPIDRILTSADVFIDLPSILCLGAVVDAVVILTRIATSKTESRAADHNHKALTKRIILKPLYSFLRHLEPLAVNGAFQMSRGHSIDKFLSSEDKARIQVRRGGPGGHGDVDINSSGATEFKQEQKEKNEKEKEYREHDLD